MRFDNERLPGGRVCLQRSGAAGAALLLALLTGCARQAVVASDGLPVTRVVVYRNGVAYFERAGRVLASEVRFKMRPAELGDFLATLAVMERGGSSVRAAAFPLPDANDEAQDAEPGGPRTREAKPADGLKVVVLSLDGKEHDLEVGYVAESPVWRPSYRLVLRANGEADLQAWGIVENLSGEDWKDVSLSLVVGAPLAFQAELGTPVIPPRPVVTDEGEIIAAVPHAETSLDQSESPPPPPAPMMNAPAPEPEDERAAPVSKSAQSRMMRPKMAARAERQAPAPMAQAAMGAGAATVMAVPRGPAISPPRSIRSLAAVAETGGSTRYDLPLRVTVPDRSATMVLLLSRRVSGEALFLFAPDGGVPDSASHPFRVARFSNSTDGELDRGPIAVFEDGSFLGQGMLDPLPLSATTTVPFALERALAVDQSRRMDEVGARIAKIENGELTIERDSVTQTTYRVRNGGEQAAKLLVKHPRIAGSRLFTPPTGTEDNVGTGTALVPGKVPPHATVDVVVDERVTIRKPEVWFSGIADSAIAAYLSDPKSDRDLVKKLTAANALRTDITKAVDEHTKLETQEATLQRASEETRKNLAAIEKNKTADGLRQKLTARLAETSAKQDDVNRRVVELDAKLAELRVLFSEATREIVF